MVEGFAKLKILPLLVVVAGVAGLAYFGRKPYQAVATIQDLLNQNKTLKQAITNLSSESQIGYAKLFTTLKFVETARDDKTKKILEKEFTIAGDIVHFDALIVKFGSKMVMDGRTRALYLWRRVYGEKMTPQQGFPIEEPGTEPQRYGDLLRELPIKQREMFWSSIWELANDPEKLAAHDIEAIYGNVVYSKLRSGLIYVFKINSTGQVYPEIVPDI